MRGNFGARLWCTVVGARGHAFCAEGEPDFDGAGDDLVGDLLDGEETRGAEAVDD